MPSPLAAEERHEMPVGEMYYRGVNGGLYWHAKQASSLGQ